MTQATFELGLTAAAFMFVTMIGVLVWRNRNKS